MQSWLKILIGFGLIALLVGIAAFLLRSEESQVRAQLVAPVDEARGHQSAGYRRAEGPTNLEFPADHGPHLDYHSEWWYYTGNLETAAGRHLGYQLTFFRSALVPPAQRQERSSSWASDQVYMAHFTLTDVDEGRFLAFERFSRGAAGLAGAEASPYRVWLENWSVEEVGPGAYRLHAAQDDVEINLQLTDLKGPILQGDQGYSQKGPEPGNASYYYSLTRLASSGAVGVGSETISVEGWSWMDHEYSTRALGPELVGWDWFSVQLDDGSELMVYQFRREDGGVDPFSSGTYIDADGRTTSLSRQDFQVSAKATWRSPHSGATYPAGWMITVPTVDLALEITPHQADQELNVSYTYWEGAVRATGEHAGSPVFGNGYVELTGYAGSMQGQF